MASAEASCSKWNGFLLMDSCMQFRDIISDRNIVVGNDKTTRLRVMHHFLCKTLLHFIFQLFIWSCYVLLLNKVILKKLGGLHKMVEK